MTQATAIDASQGDLAYEKIFAAIRTGLYQPGDRLRESDVAAELGISRTPIREAFRRLEADGILEHKPRLGTVVRTLSHAEVVELYEMRIVLERTAARMATKHASAAEIDEIDDLNEALQRASDPAVAAQINEHLHRCLALAARNRFLLASTRALTNALMLLGPTTLDDEPRIAEVHAQHGAIIAALRAGDPDRAAEAAAAHIETSLRHRLKAMRR